MPVGVSVDDGVSVELAVCEPEAVTVWLGLDVVERLCVTLLVKLEVGVPELEAVAEALGVLVTLPVVLPLDDWVKVGETLWERV